MLIKLVLSSLHKHPESDQKIQTFISITVANNVIGKIQKQKYPLN